jgi:phosphoglycerate dehydrogenase-like enzyme
MYPVSIERAPMPKTKLLVICPRDHYVLRNLAPLYELSEITISNDQAELEKLAPEADVILFTGLSGATVNWPTVWQHATSVRWVHSLSTGVEQLLFPALVDSNVSLTNARGVFKRSLAEFAVLGILFHTKKLRRLIDNQRDRKWDNFTVNFANGRVMGVIGYGEIGRECARLAKGLGMKILAIRRNPMQSADDAIADRIFGPAELHAMLARIDVLLCAAPLTPETHHMVSDAQFKVMKPTVIVVNVGRGPVIDEAALIRALQSQQIAGASLDVFEHEPLPVTSPLWAMENVLISPHCTDRTTDPDCLDLSMQMFIENLHRYQNHEPLKNVVDKKAGY